MVRTACFRLCIFWDIFGFCKLWSFNLPWQGPLRYTVTGIRPPCGTKLPRLLLPVAHPLSRLQLLVRVPHWADLDRSEAGAWIFPRSSLNSIFDF